MSAADVDRTNDFAIRIASVNGTGSASANGLLMQAIFRMGIPVTGKNVFPSNIQGLPTWYEMRISGRGYTARAPRFDLTVAMNPETTARDIADAPAGGWVLHDSSWPLDPRLRRDDLTFLGMPLGELCVEAFEGDRERTLMKNIAYAGALVALIGIDMEVVRGMLSETFGKKPALMDSNIRALHLGYDYATRNFQCPLPIRLRPMDGTRDHVLIDGNTAAALGCLYAGATVGAWYPITPATSLMEAFKGFCERYRNDPDTKRKRYCIVQAEDELAAAGIVIGAAWTGARAFTPTSGPGISLMSEFIGLAYYAEVPGVFFDVQRAGPSTGMPTRVQQADLLSLAYCSHGDTKHIVLFPSDPGECFTLAVAAFDISDRFQTPVFVASDLDIGMNDWMCRRLTWDDEYRPDRGKVFDAGQLEKIERFSRYLDADGDGIAARSLPGVHPKGAYFVRGSGHDRHGGYTENAADYREVVERIARKIAGAAEHLPPPEVNLASPSRQNGAGPSLGILTLGSCRGAVAEAADRLREEGVAVDWMRIRAFPFARSVREFLDSHDRVVVVEQNRDGQLRTLLLAETGLAGERLGSIREYGGLPMSAEQVLRGIEGVSPEVATRSLRSPAHAADLSSSRFAP